MNHKLYKRYGAPLLATLALCAACTEDNGMDALMGSGLEGGELLVDYAVGESLTRSVSHDPVPANKRISSLTYLLFDAQGELVKRREIPDMDKMEAQDWPMTRTNMTFAQREALRDTLKQGQNYTAVFVANADPKLFDGENVLHLPVTSGNKQKLEEVYLSLPATTAFNDGNMFYLDINEIAPTTDNDREHPYNSPVMLERIVNRTDFFSDDYPAWDTRFTQGKIREFTDKVYGQLIPEGLSEKKPLEINEWLKQFTDAFALFATQKGYMGVPTFPAWIADFTRVLNSLDYSGYITGISQDEQDAIKKMLYDSCLKNDSLKGLWQPWTGLMAKVAYTQCANRFFLKERTSQAEAGEITTPMLDIVTLEGNTPESKKQHTFTMIGFGGNSDATDGKGQNKMKEIQLYGKDNAVIATLPLTQKVQSFAGQGSNVRVQLAYCPIKEMAYNTNCKTGQSYSLKPVALETSISTGMGSYNQHKAWLQDFLDTQEGQKFGENMNAFVLQIALPDLSQEEALTITPEWTVRERTVKE